MLEAPYHEEKCFITFTYDDDHFPPDGSVDKQVLQKTFKVLRNYSGVKGLKYFACGEYGSEGGRPHYHFALFGWLPKDLQLVPGSRDKYYSPGLMKEVWNYGQNTVGGITFDSARYVAKYILKRPSGSVADEMVRNGLSLPFGLQSKGLGKQFVMGHYSRLHANPRVSKDGIHLSLPRYFVKLLKLPPSFTEEVGRRTSEIQQAAMARQGFSTGRIFSKEFVAGLAEIALSNGTGHFLVPQTQEGIDAAFKRLYLQKRMNAIASERVADGNIIGY